MNLKNPTKSQALLIVALIATVMYTSGCSKRKEETEQVASMPKAASNYTVNTTENVGSQWTHTVKWGVYQDKDVKHVTLFDTVKVGDKNKAYMTYHCSDKNELVRDVSGSYFVYAGYPVQTITVNNVIYDAYKPETIQAILKQLETTKNFKTVIRDNITVGYTVTSLPKAALPCRKTE